MTTIGGAGGAVRLDLVLERLQGRLPPPPARVIDVGGGTGALAVPLAAAGYEVTLIDASEEWLDRVDVVTANRTYLIANGAYGDWDSDCLRP
jgi:2-polyprenyl-3-methyl-5-hydroxy-6-metoxy-1,4-benzoquinol methylase